MRVAQGAQPCTAMASKTVYDAAVVLSYNYNFSPFTVMSKMIVEEITYSLSVVASRARMQTAGEHVSLSGHRSEVTRPRTI